MLPRKPPVFRALPSITLLLKPFGVREFLDRSSTVQLDRHGVIFQVNVTQNLGSPKRARRRVDTVFVRAMRLWFRLRFGSGFG
jgi:hypothetical protein